MEVDKSLTRVFLERCNAGPNSRLYGILDGSSVRWVNYLTALRMTLILVEYLQSLDVKNVVGVFSDNRYEYMVAEHSIYILGKASCSIYSMERAEYVRLIMCETEMTLCFMTAEAAEFMCRNGLLEDVLLRHVVLFGRRSDIEKEMREKGISVHYFDSIMKRDTAFAAYPCVREMDGVKINAITSFRSLVDVSVSITSPNEEQLAGGAESEVPPPRKDTSGMRERSEMDIYYAALDHIEWLGLEMPSPGAIATICYTSGTTGTPKGVMLSHSNFLAVVNCFYDEKAPFKVSKDDVYVSYLTMSHVLERVVVNVVMSQGASIGFVSEAKNLVQGMKVIRPTIFVVVPKILSRIRERVEKNIRERGFTVRTLYALECTKWLGVPLRWLSLNTLSKRIQEEFGGRLRACMSGGAWLDPKLCDAAQRILGCRVFQGYGQTETTGAVCIRPLKKNKLDTVGMPFPCTQVKLAEDGEIYVKGDSVFQGYFESGKLTEDSFDEKGWFKTGDIGVEEDGMYRITGRKKDTFKMDDGEYVSPEVLEDAIQGEGVDDVFVIQSANKTGIVIFVFGESDRVESLVRDRVDRLIRRRSFRALRLPKKIVHVRGFDTKAYYTSATRKKRRSDLASSLERMPELAEYFEGEKDT